MLDRASTAPMLPTEQLLQQESMTALLGTDELVDDSTHFGYPNTQELNAATAAAANTRTLNAQFVSPEAIRVPTNINTSQQSSQSDTSNQYIQNQRARSPNSILSRSPYKRQKTSANNTDAGNQWEILISNQLQSQNSRMEEERRHNRHMELMTIESQQIEDKRLTETHDYEMKQRQLDYDMKVMQQYHQMLHVMNCNHSVIAHSLPDSIKFFPQEERLKYEPTTTTIG
jgi:hypothetical protein